MMISSLWFGVGCSGASRSTTRPSRRWAACTRRCRRKWLGIRMASRLSIESIESSCQVVVVFELNIVNWINCCQMACAVNWASCYGSIAPWAFVHSPCSTSLIQVIRHSEFKSVVLDILSRPGNIVRFPVCIWLVLTYYSSCDACNCVIWMCWSNSQFWCEFQKSNFPQSKLQRLHIQTCLAEADLQLGLAPDTWDGQCHHPDLADGRVRSGALQRKAEHESAAGFL